MPSYQSGDMGKIGCGIFVIFFLVIGFEALIGSLSEVAGNILIFAIVLLLIVFGISRLFKKK